MPVAPPSVKTVTNNPEQAVGSGNGAPIRVPPARRRYSPAKLLRIVAGIKDRVMTASYNDPLFARPDVVEDDYYRFRNQPR